MPQLSDDLFLAILAMDAYNRRAGAHVGDIGVGLGNRPIGDATVGKFLQQDGVSFFGQEYIRGSQRSSHTAARMISFWTL